MAASRPAGSGWVFVDRWTARTDADVALRNAPAAPLLLITSVTRAGMRPRATGIEYGLKSGSFMRGKHPDVHKACRRV